MVDSLLMRSRDIILTDMRQSASITLRILKSLYSRADLDALGEGFTVTCSNEEALKLVEDFAVTVGHVIDTLGVDMSQGYMMYFSTLSPFRHVTMLSGLEIVFASTRYSMREFLNRLIMNYHVSFIFN
jgi:hypothetical protein